MTEHPVATASRNGPAWINPQVPLTRADLAYAVHGLLPFSVQVSLCRAFAALTTKRRLVRVVRENLRAALPCLDRMGAEELSRQYFGDQMIRRLLVAQSPRLDAAEIARMVEIDGLDHVRQVHEEGRGGILLLSHLNSFGGLLGVIRLRRLGFDMRVALADLHDPWGATPFRRGLDRVAGRRPGVLELMGAFYAQFNVRPIVQALKQGATVVQTGDGWHAARFVEVPFLGRRMPFPTGMTSIAAQTGAPLIPGFCVGRPPEMTLVIEKPLTVAAEGDGVREAVARWASLLEGHLRRFPAAWEHWSIPDLFDALNRQRSTSLRERYHITGSREAPTER